MMRSIRGRLLVLAAVWLGAALLAALPEVLGERWGQGA